jgi:hypothetical protein
MSHTGAVLTAICLLAACAHPADGPSQTTSGVGLAHLEARPERPGRQVDHDPGSSGSRRLMTSDGSTPAAAALEQRTAEPDVVAAGEIIRLLEREGLFVLDQHTDIDTANHGATATVEVRVLYGTGRSHPRDGVYRVALQTSGGAWRVVAVEAAP